MPATLASHDTMSLLAVPGIMELLFRRTPEEIAQAEADKLNPKPEPVPDASYTDDDYALYCSARRIADLVFEVLEQQGGTSQTATSSRGLWIGDRRHETVNPFYSQTAHGLRLEISYGTPKSIHTPWGEWSICGGSCSSGNQCELFMRALLDRLDTDTYIAKYYATGALGGEIGPVYNLKGLGGAPLPPVADHAPGAPRRSYIDAKAQWRAMSDRYEADHPEAVKMQWLY